MQNELREKKLMSISVLGEMANDFKLEHLLVSF
jgi:hypothetical protein